MSVSKLCEPLCACIGDHCAVSKRVLHITSAVIWFCGITAVNSKLIIYMDTVSQGISDEYDVLCLPDSNNNNRTYIPFIVGAFIGLLQLPWIYKFVRRNYTRIEHLTNNGYIISQNKSCYKCSFLSFLTAMIMLFVALDNILCGMDNKNENVKGAKCWFIGLDACVGLFLLFGFSGFIMSWIKGPIPDNNYTQLIINKGNDSNESNDALEEEEDEPNTVI